MIKQSRRNSINELIQPYPGRWVALSADEHQVVGVAKTARAALNKAQEKGERFPHLVKAPDSTTAAFIY